MVTLSIFSALLVLSFSVFVFVATWYVTPMVQVTDISNSPLARPVLKPFTWESGLIRYPENNYAIRGVFE